MPRYHDGHAGQRGKKRRSDKPGKKRITPQAGPPAKGVPQNTADAGDMAID
jgi:hypothetical protein